MTKIDCKCRIQLEFQTPSILGFCKPEWQFDLLVAATNQGETSSQSVPLYSVQGYMFYPSDFSIILTIILCGFFPGFFSQNNSYLLIFFPLFNSLIFPPLFFSLYLFPLFSPFSPFSTRGGRINTPYSLLIQLTPSCRNLVFTSNVRFQRTMSLLRSCKMLTPQLHSSVFCSVRNFSKTPLKNKGNSCLLQYYSFLFIEIY